LPQTDTASGSWRWLCSHSSVIFNVGTYNYYRGLGIDIFHGGPVSPTKHHLTLSQANSTRRQRAASTCILMPAAGAPVHVVAAELLNNDRAPRRGLGRSRSVQIAEN